MSTQAPEILKLESSRSRGVFVAKRPDGQVIGVIEAFIVAGEVRITTLECTRGYNHKQVYRLLIDRVKDMAPVTVIEVPERSTRLQIFLRDIGFRCTKIVQRKNGVRYRFVHRRK